MPKTVKNIWPEIARFSNLADAYRLVRKGKRMDSDTLAFYGNLEENLFSLEEQLLRRTWRPSPFREFVITVPKLRRIQAPEFCDRVVHQAVITHTSPVFERRFIDDSFANRKGKGVHAASFRLRQFLRSATAAWERPYLIKADIKSYFASVSHKLLMARVERFFRDSGVLWFFDTLIHGSGYTDCGLPIGSLTSQWLANLYLDSLDHYIKEELRVKCYVRYMDDFVLVGPDKEWSKATLARIAGFVEHMELRLNPKTEIRPLSKGVDFVGYRHWTDHVLPRKRTVKKAKKTFKSLQKRYNAQKVDYDFVRSRVVSFLGYMRHCNGRTTVEHMLKDFVLVGAGKREKEED